MVDVKIGDVWSSATGRNLVRAERIEPCFPGSTWIEVHWRRLTKGRLPTGSVGKCGEHNFSRGRTLVERSGVRIGDIREDGGAAYRVTGITGDRCDVEGDGGSEDLALSTVAAWRLVARGS